jgi:hypothetical protein
VRRAAAGPRRWPAKVVADWRDIVTQADAMLMLLNERGSKLMGDAGYRRPRSRDC